jgi:SAM-dependent methyltransferase
MNSPSLTDVCEIERKNGLNDFLHNLPPEFDPGVYRSIHPDLQAMSATELADHYRAYGRNEGRRANRLRDRNEFVTTIPATAEALEIGPFTNPLLRGPKVRYVDVLSREGLIARAQKIGLDPTNVPEIHYVAAGADLSVVDRCFDVVVSSHCLEHQPDLVGHLQDVAGLLNPGGGYFLLVPDKRYCFDHFIPLSNAAEVVAAHHEKRQRHTLRSVIEHRALTTHNDCPRHWQGDHGVMLDGFAPRLKTALGEYSDAGGAYIDVHGWYFTPDSAAEMLSALADAGMCPLTMLRLYPTRYGGGEFWMVLQKQY